MTTLPSCGFLATSQNLFDNVSNVNIYHLLCQRILFDLQLTNSSICLILFCNIKQEDNKSQMGNKNWVIFMKIQNVRETVRPMIM